ncbi:hypothetical protein FRC07_014108, partial [Ceratobasidium sp. 392]
ASRSTTALVEEQEGAESPKPKLRTRASLLSLSAQLASRQNSSSGRSTSASAGHISDSVAGSGGGGTPQARPRAQTSPNNPRPRSALMRLAARFMPSEQGYSATQVDESYDTVDEGNTSADAMLSEPDQSRELEIGQSTPIVELGALPLPPVETAAGTKSPTSPTTSPTYTRNRTWSKLSATSRRVFERPLSGTFSGFSHSNKRQSVISATSEFGSPGRGRFESLTRRPSADFLSSEGATEGTVMYGVGEEMLRLMFGGAPAGPTPSAQGPTPALGPTAAPIQGPTLGSDHMEQPRSSTQIRNRSPSKLQAPSSRERTRSLPRRVSPPRGNLAMLFTPPQDLSDEQAHEAEADGRVDIGLLPDFGGALDLRFSNPATTNPSASGRPSSSSARRPSSSGPPRRLSSSGAGPVRRKGHRRGMSSKENERAIKPRVTASAAAKSRSRSKSAPLGVSPELQKSFNAVEQAPIKPGILMNGNSNLTPPLPRVVVVNSATTPTRQTAKSNPMPVQRGGGDVEGAGGDEVPELPDMSTLTRA